MGWPKGKSRAGIGCAGIGRKKGIKNKLPRALKEKVLAISEQLEQEGKGLEDEARKKPAWFYENFIKPMLPKNVEVSAEMQVKLKTDEELNKQIMELLRKGEVIA